ncbi:MAG: hypothetical protein JXR20_05255 [Balneola sp.]
MKRSFLLLSLLMVGVCLPITLSAQKIDHNTSPNLSFDKKFIVIAHRGASGYYPENTMSAFKAAIEMKADMIELDVLLSKDNVPIVFHDEKLDKKTNGEGLVQNLTLSELQKLDAGLWFDKKFEGEKIPTLREVLEYCRNKILVNVEIKTEAVSENEHGGVEERVMNIIKDLGVEEQIIISSFDYRVIERITKSNSKIRTALLYEKKQSKKRSPVDLVKDYQVDAFNFNIRQLNDDWASQLNYSEIPFFIYTVNDEEKMRKVMEAGAKGIFSDKPDLLKKVADQIYNEN